jgi:hypothetical protein
MPSSTGVACRGPDDAWSSATSITGQGKDAILQPPKPEIPPSAEVLQCVAGRDADSEAAD